MDLLVFFIDWCRHFLNFPTLPISLRYSFILSVSFLECQSSWDERFNGCLELCWFFWKWVTIIHVIASVAVRKPSAGFTTAIVKEKKRGRTRRHPLNFDWRKKIERNMIGQWSPSRPLTRWPRWRIKKEKTHTHTTSDGISDAWRHRRATNSGREKLSSSPWSPGQTGETIRQLPASFNKYKWGSLTGNKKK